MYICNTTACPCFNMLRFSGQCIWHAACLSLAYVHTFGMESNMDRITS